MILKNHARAVRYRQLALVETDKAKAAVLYKIADEAERDVLCSVDRTGMGFGRFEATGPVGSIPAAVR